MGSLLSWQDCRAFNPIRMQDIHAELGDRPALLRERRFFMFRLVAVWFYCGSRRHRICGGAAAV